MKTKNTLSRQTYQKSNKSISVLGFTLVELIVVITILAILGTIGFVQMNGFASSARDSRRVSDMSNIQKIIDIQIVQQGVAPVPSLSTVYTGGTVSIQVGKADSTSIAKMSGDFSDPLTQEAYNYSVFGNGNYYQIGIDFENPLSYTIGIPGIETVYAADTSLKYSRLGGNYKFDPSLPSLFPIVSTINSSSGGIFSPDVCFVMEGSSTNTFGSSSGSCVAKKDVVLNGLDSSLVGYWDMESLTASGLLKDLSGNGWHGKCYNSNTDASSGSCLTTWPILSSGSMVFDGTIGKSVRILNSTGVLAGEKQMTIVGVVRGYCDTPTGACTVLRAGWTTNEVKSFKYFRWAFYSEISTDNLNYKNFSSSKIWNTNDYSVMWTVTYNGNNVKIYENWILKNQYSWTWVISNSNMDWYIGKMIPNDPQNSFSGTISEVKLYNRALSDSEIKQQAKIAGF